MSAPVEKTVRITYVENGAYLMEAATQVRAGFFNRNAIRLIMLTVFVIIILTHVIPDARRGSGKDIVIDLVIGISLLLYMWILGVFGSKRRRLKAFNKKYSHATGRDQTKVSCEFSGTGLLITAEDGLKTELPWSSIYRTVLYPSGIIFYTAPEQYRWFPERFFFSPDDYNDLNKILQAKIRKIERAHVKS
jgi:hypothetical protein